MDGVRPGARRARARRARASASTRARSACSTRCCASWPRPGSGGRPGSQFVFSQHCKSLRGLGVDEDKIDGRARTGRPPTASTPPSGWCSPTPTAWPSTTVGCPTGCSTPCGTHLADEEILELTYITTLYLQHAVMSRALRTEFDDRPEPIVEVVVDGDNTGAGRPGRHPSRHDLPPRQPDTNRYIPTGIMAAPANVAVSGEGPYQRAARPRGCDPESTEDRPGARRRRVGRWS